jgi:hemoglobin
MTSPPPTVHVSARPLPAGLDEAMVAAVVHGFYDRIREDALLGPVFGSVIAPDHWPAHLSRMVDFWSSMLLHSGRYQGRPMAPHLAIPGLDEAHFRRWLALFDQTVNEICPPHVAALFMDRALRIAHSFRLAIAARRGEASFLIEPITLPCLRPAG